MQSNSHLINSSLSAKLLGLEIDDKLTFKSNVEKLCKKYK